MPFNPDTFSSLEQEQQLKLKIGLEDFSNSETRNTFKNYPKPFVSILQDDPTAYKTIADII